jgi:hypothetical protein
MFSNPQVFRREAVESGKNGTACVLDAKICKQPRGCLQILIFD